MSEIQHKGPRLIKRLLLLLFLGLGLSIAAGSFLHARKFDLQGRHVWIGSCVPAFGPKQLEESLRIGTGFLLKNQQPAGNFEYEYDWLNSVSSKDDNQVRQAGALWGLALIYQFRSSSDLTQGLNRAFRFFGEHSRLDADGARYVIYPGDPSGKTGTIALIVLSYLDYLRSAAASLPAGEIKEHRGMLDQYLAMLVKLRRNDGLWFGGYDTQRGVPTGQPSPYSDGEALLALVKAARYFGRTDLKELIISSAEAGQRVNIVEALKQSPDSAITKGYYQWSSMAFYELAGTGWSGVEKYRGYVVELADWMIDVHRTLERSKNTAYAYEGIIHAYRAALDSKDNTHAKKFGCVIEQGLSKLTSWQVGHSTAVDYIGSSKITDLKALGGIQNSADDAPLRVDVTQHQMHAVILALSYYYSLNS